VKYLPAHICAALEEVEGRLGLPFSILNHCMAMLLQKDMKRHGLINFKLPNGIVSASHSDKR
jgi:hypothetical protein